MLLKKRLSAKFVAGDVRWDVRKVASSLGLAPRNEATSNYTQLQHPPAEEDFDLPAPLDNDYACPTVATDDDARSVISTRICGGEAGGWMVCVLVTLGLC